MAVVGLIVGDNLAPVAGDVELHNIFVNAGHSVTYIDDGAVPPGGFDAYVISETALSTTAVQYDPDSTPCLILEPTSWNDMRLCTLGDVDSGSSASFNLSPHLITAGLSSPCTVRSTAASQFGVLSSDFASGVDIFATSGADSSYAVGMAAEKGATLTSGTAPARRAGLCYTDSWPLNLTANGLALLLSALNWVLATPLAVSVWDGGSEQPAEVSVWNGSSEVQSSLDRLQP